MTVEEFLNEKGKKTEEALRRYLDQWRDVPSQLDEAIRYSLFAEGKRLRPALALGAADVVSKNDEAAMPVACAVEMIHCYSLIHDDLPCMDDDDLRRGKPTSHKVFGEAMAILAGDGLLTMAFDVLARAGNVDVIREITTASGVTGMAGGQALDLAAEGQTLDEHALERIHRAKTGALIEASVRCGAMLAGASPEEVAALSAYGAHLGLAFQIADDILDVVGNEDDLGKKVGADEEHGKLTYPGVVGLEESRRRAEVERDAATEALSVFGDEAVMFRNLAAYVVLRTR